MKRLVLYFKEHPKGLILSDEHIRRLTEWFGPDRSKWAAQRLQVYREDVKDTNGKVIGETIGIRRTTE